MKRIFGMLLLAGAALAVAADDKKDDAKAELKKFEGNWTAVSFEKDGKKAPDEFIKAIKVVVKGDTVSISAGDTVVAESTFKIDPTKKPKTMDSTSTKGEDKGKTSLAIYEFDGDTLKICFADEGKKERPKEFSGKEGSGNVLTIYKRQKP